MEKNHQERIKRVLLIAIPIALGAAALKTDMVEKTRTKSIAYWEASRSICIDLIQDGLEKSSRLAGRVTHGPGGIHDVLDVDVEDIPISQRQIEEFEEAFPPPAQESN